MMKFEASVKLCKVGNENRITVNRSASVDCCFNGAQIQCDRQETGRKHTQNRTAQLITPHECIKLTVQPNQQGQQGTIKQRVSIQ